MIRYVDKPVKVPERLLKAPCEPVGAGETLESLAKGYIKNTSCVGQYENSFESIRKYNNSIGDKSAAEQAK